MELSGGSLDISYGNESELMFNITNWLLEILNKDDFNGSWMSLQAVNVKKILSDQQLLARLMKNQRVSDVTFFVLITVYSILILIGITGNAMVIWAVIRQPAMRTLRNTFVVNLAFSDTLLCLFTMPLTLVEILTKYWPFGDSVLTCKAAGGLQAVSIFVSTISIIAISLDRYQVIVYPTKDYFKKIGAFTGIISIWMASFFLATPIFMVRTLKNHLLPFNLTVEAVNFCFEEWPVEHGRAIFSIFTICIQYIAPIITVSIVHAKICRKLRLRQSALLSMCSDSHKKNLEKRRLKKLNVLLMAIASIFALCWMPLNVYNVVVDLFAYPTEETMLIVYSCCHMVGMTSALINPLLYGWLNENFRREFLDIAHSIFACIYWPRNSNPPVQHATVRTREPRTPSPQLNEIIPLARSLNRSSWEITADTNTNCKQTAL